MFVAMSTRQLLSRTSELASRYLDDVGARRVGSLADYGTLLDAMGGALPDAPRDPLDVIERLVTSADPGLVATAGPRHFGFVIGGALPAALAADWLSAAWDQNAFSFVLSPAAAVVEEVARRWLTELLGLAPDTSMGVVTGATMANFTSLAAARHALLLRLGWNVEEQGLFGAPPIRILTSSERHGSFERAVRLLGFGTGNIQLLPVDDVGRLIPSELEQKLQESPDSPTLVLLQAGDINIGAYDNFEELIPVAKRYGAWVHVDGAFGLWVSACERLRHLARGIERADSWATDGHKWLNVPFDCGFAFVADAEAHRASLASNAAYITLAKDARDEMDWNPEWSRRSRCFASYAAIRQLGRRGIDELVDRCCRHAHSIVTRIGELEGAELVWDPTINQGLVRFLDRSPNATGEDHDRRTEEVIAKIQKSGEAFFGGTTWRGRRAMRVSVVNWRTSDEDVERVIRAVAQILQTK